MDLRGMGELYNASELFITENVNKGLGEKVAIYFDNNEITYSQVQMKVNQVGNMLKELGIKIEDRILLNCYDTPEFIYSFFGAMKIGAVPIPVNTMMQPSDYEYYLNNSRAKILIIHQELWDKICHLRDRFIFLEKVMIINENALAEFDNVLHFNTLVNNANSSLTPLSTTIDDSAFWLFSSGSTGNPKGVIHLHHDMEFALNTYGKKILKITEEDRCLSASKLFFAYGLGGGMYFPLGVGGSTVLVREKPTPELIMKAIEKYRPTIFFGVPTLYGAMIDYSERNGKQYDLSSIRVCVSAGEALPPSFIHKWRDLYQLEILDGIGSTEALHIFLSNEVGNVKEGSSGKVVPGYEARIINDQGEQAEPNEVGNLFIKGDSIAHCYWNLHEQNKQKFSGEWYETGDKYYVDQDGYYWYCGRSDDMLKVGGIWVSPIEIENCLLQHKDVFEVAVVGESDANMLVIPKAFIVLKEGVTASDELKQELKEFTKNNLARYKYPRIIVFIEDLPKTATGKIQRFKLREELKKRVIQS